MTTLKQAIDAMRAEGDAWHGHVPANWQQGRTAYGGFSSALALVAAQRAEAALPPLRSAQISFVGPLAGALVLQASVLRRGRNAAFVAVDVAGEAGLGLRATFVFMRAIESIHHHEAGTAPAVAPPGADERLDAVRRVAFTGNFDLVDRPDGLGPAEWRRWIRLAERDGLDPAVELVAVADCLPPAALKPVGAPVPVSSVTWLLNLVEPVPATRNGWWLLHAGTERLAGGASSQRMAIWNADRRPVAEQLQSVAVFG